MPIVWDRRLSTGNRLIDQDHQYMICLFNSIELALSKPDVLPQLPMFFDQLVEHTREHFQREEAIQLRIEYPRYAAHRLEHAHIMASLEQINTRIGRLVAAGVDVQDAAPYHEMMGGDFMGRAWQWVIGHLLKSDLDLVPYLEKHAIRLQ